MSRDHRSVLDQAVAQLTSEAKPDSLDALLDAPASSLNGGLPMEAGPASMPVVGQLLALEASTCRAWVTWPGRTDSAAQLARSVVALHGGHVGQDVVLMFEQGDLARPLVMGVIQTPAAPDQRDTGRSSPAPPTPTSCRNHRYRECRWAMCRSNPAPACEPVVPSSTAGRKNHREMALAGPARCTHCNVGHPTHDWGPRKKHPVAR